jgi:hypothetical protein
MGLIQGIDAGSLISAFRQGRADRMAAEEWAWKRQTQQEDREMKRRAGTLLGRMMGGDQADPEPLPPARGVLGQVGGGQTGGIAGAYRPSMESLGVTPYASATPRPPAQVGPGVTPSFEQAFSNNAMDAISRGETPAIQATPGAGSANGSGQDGARVDAHNGPHMIMPNQAELAEFMGLEPELGGKIISAISSYNTGALKQLQARNDAMGVVAHYVATAKTPQERSDRFAHARDHLLANGWSDQEVANADLSDAGLDRYQRLAVGFDHMIGNEIRQRRLDNDIADDEADNARADRNTDSMISTRQGRLSETRRYHDATTRTRQRGQDVSATTARRGQDIRGAGGGRAAIPTVATPADAMKLAPGTKFRTPDGTIRVRP